MNVTGRKVLSTSLMVGVASMGLGAPAFSSAQAQALQPVVDVCTGLSLNESALTDILDAVNQGIVDEIETVLNPLALQISLPPLLVFEPLDLTVSDVIANVTSGNPISIQALSPTGDILAPSECNLTAENLTLNEEGGIEIGGNRVSGLGEDGLVASAAEIDAIALGNNASTGAGATGAVAIGTNASVTAANSVAIGNNSLADRGALTGYTAAGLTGTFDSIGTVSVGADGALRQITNVAPGTQASDAATVGQVQGALDAIAALDAATENGVLYDDATQTSVTLAGAGGTVIDNLADGTLSAGSAEAVNGSQLFATNQQVDTNAADIVTAQTGVTANAGDIATLQSDVSTNTANIAANTGDIATNTGDIAANSADIAQLQSTAVMYDDATQASITLGGASGTTIGNLADGELSATSTEAVNGSQLFATNQQVDTNTDAIANLSVTVNDYDTRITQNEGDIANLDGRVTVNEGDIANLDNRVTVNEGDIANLDTRVTVNEGDIANLDTRVTVNEGDIATIDSRVTVNEGDIIDIDGRVTTNTTDIANIDGRVTVNEGDIQSLEFAYVDIDDRVTVNSTSITNIQTQLDNVPLAYVDDGDTSMTSDTPTNTVAMIGAGGNPVRVTNVAAGQLSAGSTDAVNGTQLAATNDAVANNRVDIDQNTSDITNLRNNIAGSTVVAVQYSNPETPTQSNGGTLTNDVTLVGADLTQPVGLHNVADAVAATDAVNLGQMQSGLASVMANSMTYTDQRFDVLSDRIDGLSFDLSNAREEAFAGTAGALAVAGIPQTMEEGKSMFGGSIGHYRGETAFALGLSTTLNDGQAVVKAGGTMDTHGKGGFSAGAGFSF